jgi:NADPH2:quinone reductase
MAFPRVVPHSDGAGEIDMVGAGVASSRKGQRVWIWNAQWKRPMGTAAEYIVLPEAQAVPLPAPVSFEAGACLGIPALTAWRAIELAEAASGKTLLVSGGAGAVAHYAIQMAKARGATVITTVSSAAKAKMARDAGADHTIDYKTENVGERVAAITGKPVAAGGGVDAIVELDLTANAALIPAVLRARGKVVIYGTGPQAHIPASYCLVSTISLLFFLVYELTPEERRRAVDGVNRMLEANTLKHNIGATYPFDRIVEAHEAQESGKIAGNIVLTFA